MERLLPFAFVVLVVAAVLLGLWSNSDIGGLAVYAPTGEVVEVVGHVRGSAGWASFRGLRLVRRADGTTMTVPAGDLTSSRP